MNSEYSIYIFSNYEYMFVSNCLNDKRMSFLKCDAYDITQSDCQCVLSGVVEDDLVIRIKNKELYRNTRFAELNQTVFDETWKPFNGMRVLDCIEFQDNSIWRCRTFDTSKKHTICICIGQNESLNKFGSINTHILYKNVDQSMIDYDEISSFLPPPPRTFR